MTRSAQWKGDIPAQTPSARAAEAATEERRSVPSLMTHTSHHNYNAGSGDETLGYGQGHQTQTTAQGTPDRALDSQSRGWGLTLDAPATP